MHPIQIIGIGQGRKDLTQQHLEIIKGADILVGGKRQLEMFSDTAARTIAVKGHIEELVMDLEKKAMENKIVVLASGDPLFHGIGASFCRLLPPEKIVVHPNVSIVAAAFSAIKEPWHDARLISLHGSHQAPLLFSQLADEHKVLFLTDPKNDPHFIAEQLEKEGLYDFKVCVLEQLGDKENQKITWFENIDLLFDQKFSQPNIVILLKRGQSAHKEPRETYVGMNDALFRHSNGLITKSEIRAITISKLKLIRKDHILWDIGAGSGSVGIEASLHIPWGHVFAIEKNTARISDIIQNITNFNCSNVKVFNAAFPEGIEQLKNPDRIFIGGGGENLDQIITKASKKLADYGVMVVNTVLIQNLETAMTAMKSNNLNPEVTQIQVSRSKTMPFGDRFEALNPVWIISGSKQPKRNINT